ncbi:MAG: hypothetical protein K6G61_11000 [Solobacterium sp.]|nr:hypothetical protein [Solobacterium sp.]
MDHNRKIAGAVVSALLFLMLFFGYFLVMILADDIPPIFRIVFGLFYLGLCAGLLHALYRRITEIEGGEEDDLDDY